MFKPKPKLIKISCVPETNLRRVTQVEPLDEEEELKLKRTTFLGYTDVAAGGIRALLGVDHRKVFHNLDVPELSKCSVSCVSCDHLDPRHQPLAPLQVWNLMYEEVSVILVNCHVSARVCHQVCTRIADLCTKSCVNKLVVLSALRVDLPSSEGADDIFENNINDMPLTKSPKLPADVSINDPFLSTLIQMVQVDYIPTSVISIPAHRACHGQASYNDGSSQVIELFQKTITKAMNINFDLDYSKNLIYKGPNNGNSAPVSMMYS